MLTASLESRPGHSLQTKPVESATFVRCHLVSGHLYATSYEFYRRLLQGKTIDPSRDAVNVAARQDIVQAFEGPRDTAGGIPPAPGARLCISTYIYRLPVSLTPVLCRDGLCPFGMVLLKLPLIILRPG